jgi:predicted AAA+ superfamily ATPase
MKGSLKLTDLAKTDLQLRSLVIFRRLLQDDVFQKLSTMLQAEGLPASEQVSRYADFAAALFAHGTNLTDYVWTRIIEDDNIYVQKHAQKQPIDSVLETCVKNELAVLEAAAQLQSADIHAHIRFDGFLPDWQNSKSDFAAAYARHMDGIATEGHGIFAKHYMLRVKDGTIVPVTCPDPIRLADLKGYERQKKAVIGNTLALLDGKPAANALLYGDAGTGKSSTVKAIANEYHAQGLRLIEISKRQFGEIPSIAETLSQSPLKFILFIDDLSFTQQNDEFNALKAVLEGSVSAKATNIVIYATSNRRHMVKELFSDREGDDIHRNETIQELCSLSHRFGLTVGYFKPDKKAYLDIVHALKDDYGIQMDDALLDLEAERFASAGRSPRIARQFIDSLRRNNQTSR